MKKLKNLKARLLSLSLAFAMILSLAMGMAPMNAHAIESGGDGNPQIVSEELPTEVTETWAVTVDITDGSSINGQLAMIECDAQRSPVKKDGNYNIVMVEDNAIINITKGNIIALSGASGALDGCTVTMENNSLATLSDFISSEIEYGYFIYDIAGDNKIIINSTVQGGEDQGGGTETRTIESLEGYVTINGNNVTVDLGSDNTIPFGIANAPGTPKEILDGLVGEKVADSTSPYVINYGWVLIPNSQRTAAYTFANLPSNTYYVYTYDTTVTKNNETEAAVIGSYAFTIEEPTLTTYTITLDLVDINDSDLNVECWGPDDNGYDNIYTDGDTLEYKSGGRIKVSSRASDDFKVTVQGANATISEQISQYGQHYYNVTEIDGDATLVVSPKTSGGGENPTPPAGGTYIVTFDKTGYPEDDCWATVNDINDDTIALRNTGDFTTVKADSGMWVFANEEFEVTAEGATVGQLRTSGEGIASGYEALITDFTKDTTVVVKKVTSGGGTIPPTGEDPGTPQPTPTPNPDNGSNGGSSSSSDTSSTPAPAPAPAPSTAPITVPVSNGGNDNVLNINASLSGETAKVNELTAEEIDKVAKNETKDSIEINLSETGKKVKEAALPVSSLNEIARIMDDPSNKLDNVTIKLSNATVEVSEHALKAVLSKTTGNDLRLVVDDIHKDTLNNTQKESVKNQNVHMCIDAYFISNGVRIGDFQGGTATIRLPFNVPAGLNGNGFSVWYVGDDGTIEKHDTRYVNGELVFTVSHFSDYVVVYDGAVKDNVPKTGESTDYTFILWTSILAIGVLGLVLNRQKRRQ